MTGVNKTNMIIGTNNIVLNTECYEWRIESFIESFNKYSKFADSSYINFVSRFDISQRYMAECFISSTTWNTASISSMQLVPKFTIFIDDFYKSHEEVANSRVKLHRYKSSGINYEILAVVIRCNHRRPNSYRIITHKNTNRKMLEVSVKKLFTYDIMKDIILLLDKVLFCNITPVDDSCPYGRTLDTYFKTTK